MNIHCKYDELLNPKKLKNHPKNRNKHGQDQIDRLAELYKYHGIRHPIIVSKRSNCIVAGHGRKLAAIRCGMEEFPVEYQDFVSDEAEYAFLQADNAIALWAELDLSGINSDLGDLGPDFDINMLGIKDFKLDLNEEEPEGDPDAIPEHVEPKAKLGDIYQLGEHRLMCGDSTSIQDVERLMDGQKADMVFTDPPYGIDVVKTDGNVGGNRKNGRISFANAGKYGAKANCGTYKPIIGDDKPFDPSFLLTLAPYQIIWGANNFSSKLPDNSHWIVWYKNIPDNNFSGAELAWTSIDKKTVKTYPYTWAGMTRAGNRKEELAKRVHPTQKPVGLFVNIFNDYKFGSCIDLFGGSGSTLIACEKTKRKCFMMELDPHYIDVIIARWQKYSNKKAVREDGTLWDDLEANNG